MIIKVGTVIVDVLNEIPSTATILDMNILLLSTLLQCDHLFRVKSAREYGNYVIQLNCVTKEMMQQCHAIPIIIYYYYADLKASLHSSLWLRRQDYDDE